MVQPFDKAHDKHSSPQVHSTSSGQVKRMRELERHISSCVRVAIVVCRAHEDADIEAVSKLVAKQAVEQFEKLQGR